MLHSICVSSRFKQKIRALIKKENVQEMKREPVRTTEQVTGKQNSECNKLAKDAKYNKNRIPSVSSNQKEKSL